MAIVSAVSNADCNSWGYHGGDEHGSTLHVVPAGIGLHGLDMLAELGYVYGIIVSTRLARELSIQERYNEHLPTKQRLGRAAADLIADGESIVLDSGTTTEEVAQCMSSLKNLVVITDGLNIASVLAA